MAWLNFITKMNGRPAQILIDEQFRASAPITQLPRLAWFGVYCRRHPGNGFWHEDEAETLDALEDDLIRLCGQFGRGWAVYVARLATPGIREYYLYFGSGAEFAAVHPGLRAAYPDYRIEYDETEDAAWGRYKSLLAESE